MGKEKKSCQYCGEEILATAIKCKHCSSLLGNSGVRDSEPVPVRAAMQHTPNNTSAPATPGPIANFFGILVIGAIFYGGFYYYFLYEPTNTTNLSDRTRSEYQLQIESTLSNILAEYRSGQRTDNQIVENSARDQFRLWEGSLSSQKPEVTNFYCTLTEIRSGDSIDCTYKGVGYRLSLETDSTAILSQKRSGDGLWFNGRLLGETSFTVAGGITQPVIRAANASMTF